MIKYSIYPDFANCLVEISYDKRWEANKIKNGIKDLENEHGRSYAYEHDEHGGYITLTVDSTEDYCRLRDLISEADWR